MDTNIELLNQLVSCLGQLQHDSHVLFLCVESYLYGKKSSANTTDVMTNYADNLKSTVTSARKVTNALRTVIPAIVPTVLPDKHPSAKALRDLDFFINSFLPVANKIAGSRFSNYAPDSFRRALFREEALDLLIEVKDMLMTTMRLENLLKEIVDFVNSYEAAWEAVFGTGKVATLNGPPAPTTDNSSTSTTTSWISSAPSAYGITEINW